MERELWPPVYHLVMSAGRSVRQRRVTFQPHIVVLTLIWAALHDRPQGWACDPTHWSHTALRPLGLPSPATLSRRLRSVAVGVLMRQLAHTLRGLVPPRLLAILDGKPLPVGGASHDPEAKNGHGAGTIARGYKLHAIWGHRPMPEAFAIEPLNIPETKAAERLLPELAGGAGYLLGDGVYDANPVYEAAGRAGSQLIAPREDRAAGLGHRWQSPFRLRSIALLAGAFGQGLYRLRPAIERDFGQATSFGGGLGPLPAWVRRLHRVWRWVCAKLLINGVRIAKRQGLMANLK
jgi:Transposase DDE domain